MGSKNLVLLINLHHPYIKLDENEAAVFEDESTVIFRSISDFYLPLLNMLSKFEKDGVDARIPLVFSSGVCTLLNDEDIKQGYNDWLNSLIEFGQKEVVRTKANPEMKALAEQNLRSAIENKRAFNKVYGCDLTGAFAGFAEKGFAEILATCGTYLFMPHFCDMPEILNAQIESGIHTIKSYFGRMPDGFFLPEMGYAPEIEKALKLYGIGYTILPVQSFLFSRIPPEHGIFMPARCQNFLAVFAAEHFTLPAPASGVVSMPSGYSGDASVYKDTKKDLSWELSYEELAPFIKAGHTRRVSGFSYQNKAESLYNPEAARKQAQYDARSFFEKKRALLVKAQSVLGDDADVSLGVYLDCFNMTCGWAEKFEFLEALIRTSVSSGVNISSYSDLLEGKAAMQRVEPYPAAYSGSPYGENLVSNANNWMMRYVRKASERIVDLVSRFPNDAGLKVRLLNLGAKELMLVQDCTFAKLVDSNAYAEFASEYFRRGIVAFSNVYDALGSNTVSTEWFYALEKVHPIFPWMNYHIFSKKY